MALRFEFASRLSLQAPPHFALSLVLQSKSRAKSFGLAKRRQALVVRRNIAIFFYFLLSKF
ncbi:hypothetical protein CH352_18870 [Leptospira hartskeerlii]|uniref:Uncharacterized protein n=1 Tax=Leptospira hartskeerlii TaxID=2023177 RepID=A0A2M9X880_9LEPT|nr:hypothetical protein CH357_18805 [Leptospira hartskeerlii]PJZ31919.1 hypothetical protein CH352_18870 [Leptospira hartskeerlii]